MVRINLLNVMIGKRAVLDLIRGATFAKKSLIKVVAIGGLWYKRAST
jgi:hypothetical protein